MLSVLFALATAAANALAVTAQHIASTSRRGLSIGRLIAHLVRHPLWWLGWGGMVASLVGQALALHFGPLSLVQPLLVSELVIALILRRTWLRQSIRPLAWASALLTVAALAGFLVLAAPHAPAVAPPSALRWIVASGASALVAAGLGAGARRGSPRRRAALFASATAVLWAIEAAFIKATTDVITSSGYGGLFAHWPVYALIVAGIAGLLSEQSALHVGPLQVSQPLIVIVDPLASVVVGVWLFREHLATSAPRAPLAGVAFALMALGVVVLSRTAPATMEPASRGD
ncbi:MAG: DMT family transporter [Acidimicrobiales bacterium]